MIGSVNEAACQLRSVTAPFNNTDVSIFWTTDQMDVSSCRPGKKQDILSAPFKLRLDRIYQKALPYRSKFSRNTWEQGPRRSLKGRSNTSRAISQKDQSEWLAFGQFGQMSDSSVIQWKLESGKTTSAGEISGQLVTQESSSSLAAHHQPDIVSHSALIPIRYAQITDELERQVVTWQPHVGRHIPAVWRGKLPAKWMVPQAGATKQ
jgi:hypothetical protein